MKPGLDGERPELKEWLLQQVMKGEHRSYEVCELSFEHLMGEGGKTDLRNISNSEDQRK